MNHSMTHSTFSHDSFSIPFRKIPSTEKKLEVKGCAQSQFNGINDKSDINQISLSLVVGNYRASAIFGVFIAMEIQIDDNHDQPERVLGIIGPDTSIS